MIIVIFFSLAETGKLGMGQGEGHHNMLCNKEQSGREQRLEGQLNM